MVIICEECGKKYQVDNEKVKGKRTEFKCKKCGNLMTATQSSPKDPKLPKTPPQVSENNSEVSRVVTAEGKQKKTLRPSTQTQKVSQLFSRPGRFRFGLTAKLFTVMMLVGLIPLIMFWGIALTQARDRIRAEAKNNTQHMFKSMVRYVGEWFGEKERIIGELAEMDDIISMERTKQAALLVALSRVYPEMHHTFIIDADGNLFVGSPPEPLTVNDAMQQRYRGILRANIPSWQTLINNKSKKPFLLLAVPIQNKEHTVGLIAYAISLDKLSKQTLTLESGDTGFAFLIKTSKNIVAYQIDTVGINRKKLNWLPLISAYKRGRFGLVPFQSAGEKSVLGYVAKTSFNWGLGIQKEENEASFLIDQLMTFAYLLLLVTIVFVFIIAWFSGRALSRPIIKLTHAADRISVGELDMEIRTARKDEIGDLSEAIARMQDSIRVSIERLRRRL